MLGNLLFIFDCPIICLFDCLMVFNATFNNISVISWQSRVSWEATEYTGALTNLSIYSVLGSSRIYRCFNKPVYLECPGKQQHIQVL